MLLAIQKNIRALGSTERALHSLRFFKTGKGQYGHGDEFLGLSVPQCRAIVREYRICSQQDLVTLFHSPKHEERLVALLIITDQYHRAAPKEKERIYNFYLRSTSRINNWDLVDCSAYKIVGVHLLNRPRGILRTLARSKSLWERRIAIVATFKFISEGQLNTTLEIATLLLRDTHDLIHKAVGWMLREVGKRDGAALRKFLDQHASIMPRTMLRYAIERLTVTQRQHYLQKH